MAHPTENKIVSFRAMEEGWDYGEGVAFEQSTVDKTIRVHREIVRQGLFCTGAYPDMEGELAVTIYHQGLEGEFTIRPDGSIGFLLEQDGEELDSRENLVLSDIRPLLTEVMLVDV